MTAARPRVIKLGGSLLDWEALPRAVTAWRAAQPAAVDVLVVGGGALVDVLRGLDRWHGFSPETSHWLSIRAMRLTAEIVTALVPGTVLVTSLEELCRRAGEALQVLDVEHFLRQDQATGDPLPCCWEVTSDSIAARLAQALEASELVLLKSALPAPADCSETVWGSGYVDAFFARAAAGLKVRCVNLRDAAFAEITLPAPSLQPRAAASAQFEL